MSDWTTPGDIASQLTSLWNQGRMLAASLNGPSIYPLALRMRKPDARALVNRFDDVRKWISELEAGSKPKRGFGYDIIWTDWQHRQLGRNRVPTGICVESEADGVRLIGKQRDLEHFRRLVAVTTSRFPELRDWLARAPLRALEYAADWDRMLAVLEWFRDHPRSGQYLRQLDICGVDTKFIEERTQVLGLLLDEIMPADTIDKSLTGQRSFESRYGLRCKLPLVRFRILDPTLYLRGLSDLTIPASEFARLGLGVRRVFITENEINGLAFPDVSESLVVFKLGYGIELLGGCEWFRTNEVFYWGDIDTHGFVMLDRLRGLFPHARSLLMDRDTLLAHRQLWITEESQHLKPLERLNSEESELYDDLRYNHFGERVRLEQERVSFGTLEAALERIITLPDAARDRAFSP